ncbi:MAG: type II toxin-antitoxin system RelE/ParE family toxin [Thermodesulfobacteriota bacterium]|nr:type II toxin-antitoxin system RelE/ParE family toxin [Thermodesulfobacteriota bacterium]
MEYEIKTTNVFDKWLATLKDRSAVNRILSRLYRMEKGNLGDVKSVGQDLFEVRLFFGAGYRLYYTLEGQTIILLLCGGDKSSQSKDIERARKIMG